LLPKPAEHFSNEKFYETKAATTLLIRKKEVPPLPCIQRAGLAAGLEFIARPPGTAAE
jgi:hypothetical protein